MTNKLKQFIQEYWLGAAFGGVIGSGTLLVRYVKKKRNKQHCLELGLQALLRNEILKEYHNWMEKGYLPVYARDNIQNMYDQYHSLAVNGVITGLFEKLMELPTEKEKTNE